MITIGSSLAGLFKLCINVVLGPYPTFNITISVACQGETSRARDIEPIMEMTVILEDEVILVTRAYPRDICACSPLWGAHLWAALGAIFGMLLNTIEGTSNIIVGLLCVVKIPNSLICLVWRVLMSTSAIRETSYLQNKVTHVLKQQKTKNWVTFLGRSTQKIH